MRYLTSRDRPARRPGSADELRLGALGAWLTAVARSGETDAAFTARLTPPPSRRRPDHDHLAEECEASLALDPVEIRDTKSEW
ncbi:hypothetical protein ABZ958_30280 [Streptomyces sp. NPDC046237]|uniref:hypothetical protein n=1 Tax=Streptomyces sp. NPDC046237 TaxID=3154914 RepID=UPI0034095A09